MLIAKNGSLHRVDPRPAGSHVPAPHYLSVIPRASGVPRMFRRVEKGDTKVDPRACGEPLSLSPRRIFGGVDPARMRVAVAIFNPSSYQVDPRDAGSPELKAHS